MGLFGEALIDSERAERLKRKILPDEFWRVEGVTPTYITVDCILGAVSQGAMGGIGLKQAVLKEMGIDINKDSLSANPELSAQIYNRIREAMLAAYEAGLMRSDKQAAREKCWTYICDQLGI